MGYASHAPISLLMAPARWLGTPSPPNTLTGSLLANRRAASRSGPWEQIVQDPRMWQFGFGGPDMERLVAGRERIYLDRFWNDFSLGAKRFDEAKHQHHEALYEMPGAILRVSPSSRPSVRTLLTTKHISPSSPCLCWRLEAKRSSEQMTATVMCFAATDVQDASF
jgi:hypothetical protein